MTQRSRTVASRSCRITAAVLALVLASGPPAAAGSLADLLPELFGKGGITLDPAGVGGEFHLPHFTIESQQQLTVLNDSLRAQLSNLPLPSPAGGFTYRFDPALGAFVRSTESFGPIYSQRAETLGRGKLSLGVTYSRFSFDSLDGKDLGKGELRLTWLHEDLGFGVAFERDVITAQIFAKVRSDVFVLSATYGVLENLDVAVAVPIIRNEIRLRGVARIIPDPATVPQDLHSFPGGTDTLTARASDEAAGLGDVLLRGKYRFYEAARMALAAGLDVRLPTGRTRDLMGIGTVRVSPALIASGRFNGFSPHINVGFHLGDTAKIENEFFYNLGFDVGVHRRVTLAFDILGRRIIDNKRLKAGTRDQIGSDDIVDASIGVKVNPWRNALVFVNVLVPLNRTGLRADVTPLVGFEWSF